MRTVFFLVQKEFRQILRNRVMLPMIFMMPIVQTVLLSFAANYEVKNLALSIVDNDLSTASRQLTAKFRGSDHFKIVESTFSRDVALAGLDREQTDIILEIPANFERDLVREGRTSVALSANSINTQKAGLGVGYANAIIQDFVPDLPMPAVQMPLNKGFIQSTWSYWYNPSLDYKTFMVPGILGVIVTMIISFLTAMNIVREREMGTIEQLNVTPVKKWQFIAGKFIPFWIIALIIMTVGLTAGKLIFNIPMLGSLWLVFGYTAVFVPSVLGLGFLISNFADTQQQAMFTAWFFMIIFVMMCGLFTPAESMPEWAQWINKINPTAYFVKFMRMVLLKGAGFAEIKDNFFSILAYGFIVNTLAVWTYRKRV